jgi:zinc protease
VPALTDAMLMRGTSKYNRIELADAFDRLKITGGPHHFETTRANLPEALRLVAHVLKEPAFPASEFEQLRQQTLVGIESSRSEPQAVAARALAEHFNIYPRGDVRAATTIEEDIADTRAATLEQLRPSTATTTAPRRPNWRSSATSMPTPSRR